MNFDEFNKWLSDYCTDNRLNLKIKPVDKYYKNYSINLPSGDVLEAELAPDGEIFRIWFKSYTYSDIAYSVEEKEQAISELREVVFALLNSNYVEEQYFLNNKILKQELVITTSAEKFNKFTSRTGLLNRLLMFVRKPSRKTVRPR